MRVRDGGRIIRMVTQLLPGPGARSDGFGMNWPSADASPFYEGPMVDGDGRDAVHHFLVPGSLTWWSGFDECEFDCAQASQNPPRRSEEARGTWRCPVDGAGMLRRHCRRRSIPALSFAK